MGNIQLIQSQKHSKSLEDLPEFGLWVYNHHFPLKMLLELILSLSGNIQDESIRV